MQDAYVHNLGQFDWPVTRSYGFFMIPALTPGCPTAADGTPFARLIVKDKQERFDLGQMEYIFRPLDSKLVADDIVGMHEKANCLENWGVFSSLNEVPTVEEIDRVKEKMKAYHMMKLSEGDKDWARFGRHEMIDDNSRRACIALGVHREWALVVKEKAACPGCGEPIVPGIAKHASCGTVLDAPKAYELGMIDQATYERLMQIVDTRRQARGQQPAAPKPAAKPPQAQQRSRSNRPEAAPATAKRTAVKTGNAAELPTRVAADE